MVVVEAKIEERKYMQVDWIMHMKRELEEKSQMALPAHRGCDYIFHMSIKAYGALSSDSAVIR